MSRERVGRRNAFARHPLVTAIIAGVLSLLGGGVGLYIDYRLDQRSSQFNDEQRARDRLAGTYANYLAAAYAYRGALEKFVANHQPAVIDALRAREAALKEDPRAAYAGVLNNLDPTDRAPYLQAYGLVAIYGSPEAIAKAQNVDSAIYPLFVLPGTVTFDYWQSAACSLIPNPLLSIACTSDASKTGPSQTFGTADAEFYHNTMAAFQNAMCIELADHPKADCARPSASPTRS